MRFFVSALALPLALSLTVSQQAKAKDSKPAAPTQAEMMQKFMAAATPGSAHKVLADMAGDYTFTSKSWHEPKGKPMEGKGTASLKMILEGRWLEQNVTAEAAGEMPAYSGHGMLGYDNVSKKYQSMWVDTMSTGAMMGEGTFDAGSKTLKDAGTYSCPMTGEPRAYRTTWQMKDKNTLVFALFGPPVMDPKAPEYKMMELTYKRK